MWFEVVYFRTIIFEGKSHQLFFVLYQDFLVCIVHLFAALVAWQILLDQAQKLWGRKNNLNFTGTKTNYGPILQ
ncbi:hypothetical protein CNR22_18285 [Sphingobacteriaceae bacterium]|nr:hypothetical protein CNR22_18285 [Sphingobacteriaceae bacterium]